MLFGVGVRHPPLCWCGTPPFVRHFVRVHALFLFPPLTLSCGLVCSDVIGRDVIGRADAGTQTPTGPAERVEGSGALSEHHGQRRKGQGVLARRGGRDRACSSVRRNTGEWQLSVTAVPPHHATPKHVGSRICVVGTGVEKQKTVSPLDVM